MDSKILFSVLLGIVLGYLFQDSCLSSNCNQLRL